MMNLKMISQHSSGNKYDETICCEEELKAIFLLMVDVGVKNNE
jgi:hypothetical protein